jgi:hypothetical protein
LGVHGLDQQLEIWGALVLVKNFLRTSRGEVRKKKAERH